MQEILWGVSQYLVLQCYVLWQGKTTTQEYFQIELEPLVARSFRNEGLLLLLLSHFSRVRLCVTPQMAAHQAPPSLGFSRQEQWSGLPFPSNARKGKGKVKSLSRVGLLATPWTAAYQAPPPMGFSRQEYWSGVPLPSPRNEGQESFSAEILAEGKGDMKQVMGENSYTQ